MNNFDDIFDSPQNNGGQQNQPFDKEAWAEKKQAERQQVYDLADSAAEQVGKDSEMFRAYLDVQARFDRYSATNVLLILAQRPEATQLKDFEGWKDVGASIKRQQRGISILEPGEEYQRDDGSFGTSYNVKKVFDVSQTTARTKGQPVVSMDERMLLKALISHPPVPLKTVNEMPGKAGAIYDHEQQVIFVRKGMDAPSIFRSVSMELARAELAAEMPEYIREETAFPAYCASYLLCKKYEVDTSSYRFERMSEHFRDSSPQEIRSTLTEIRDTAGNISARMSRALEQNRQPKSREQER